VRIQYKCLFPICVFLEMKLHGGLDIFFSKQNYNVLSQNFHIQISVIDLNIPRIGLPRTDCWEYINRSQIHECSNWEQDLAVSFLGIIFFEFSVLCVLTSSQSARNLCPPDHSQSSQCSSLFLSVIEINLRKF